MAVGLHVARPWKSPSVVEFDFGKAHVVRADTVFQVREAFLDAERSKGRIILLTKLYGKGTWATMSWLAWPGADCSPSIIGPVSVPCSRPRNSIAPFAILRSRRRFWNVPQSMAIRRYRLAFSTRERCGARPVVMCSRWASGNRTW